MDKNGILNKEFNKIMGDAVGEAEKQANWNHVAGEIAKARRLFFCDGMYYEYQNGVYSPVKEDYIRKIIKDMIGDQFTLKRCSEIMLSLRVEIAVNDNAELNNTPLLNVKNGMLDMRTLALYPHSTEYKSTIQLPVNYDPEAECPTWIRTLEEIFAEDLEWADILQEYYGLCLTRETKYEKALFLIGEGANGKSTLLHILQQVLGKRNYSSIPLEQFANTHYTANLYNKVANISIETNAKSSVYDSLMKAIISGDTITADFKYLPAFQFNPYCKLIFALNNMPRVDDKTDAFFRRIIIIRCNRQFSEEEQNKNLRAELEREKDGIFTWMLNGEKRLQERGHFCLPAMARKEVEEYRKENSNVLTFMAEECEIGEHCWVTKQNLYDAYVTWCGKNGHKQLSKIRFGKEVKKHSPSVKEGRDPTGDTRMWEGIGLPFPSRGIGGEEG